MKKICANCNKEFELLPENTKLNELGAWFKCECGTTLFVPRRKLEVKDLINQLRNHPDIAFLNITFADEINELEKQRGLS